MAPRTDGEPPRPQRRSDDAATVDADSSAQTSATVIEQMGGVSGLIYSTVPILVFVPVNSLYGLNPAIAAAVAVAAAIFAWRVLRREPVMPAVSGLVGVAVCALIAARTGDAKGYFLFGIWASLVYAGALVVSIVVRWPLIGVGWSAISGAGNAWRRHRRTLLAYDLATAFWALVFLARFLAQSQLYDDGSTGWLAITRIAMGWPLTAVSVVITVILVRWARREESAPADQHNGAGTEPSDG